MEYNELAQVTLDMQSNLIRTTLRPEILLFQRSFEEIIQQTSVFLATTEQHFLSPSLLVTDEDVLIRHLCGFLASKLGIEGFLAFHQQTIQRTSSGDSSLANQVKAATVFVQDLLQALICHKEAADYPGKHLAMIYDREVKYFGGSIFHLNPHIDIDDDLPEIDDDYEELEDLTSYYHAEKLSHPLRQLPGTPWHKFFGNFEETRVHDAPEMSLFRDNAQHKDLTLSIPGTILFLVPEIRREYDRFREILEEASQPHKNGKLPLPLLLDEVRKEKIQILQRRLPNFHDGKIECGSFEELCSEHTDAIPRPEYALDGSRTIEMQNFTVNSPDLVGDSLPDVRIAQIASQLQGVSIQFVSEDEDE
ncbi:sporulation minus regulator 1 [Triangularia verruculosa]|uniref:Sporulation minus regulator 1 n=1 Tax=Triangularia verruculosa TaxID=2587418 RepID=A0AAN7AT72_9PEZI|nr:sporulation minus regulator 1 [Triangularia verruculosa]